MFLPHEALAPASTCFQMTTARRTCPHRGERWIARVRFSFVGSEVDLLSIAPMRNCPLQRTVSQLLDDIEAELLACRRSWWVTKQTTCLENQFVVVSAGTIEIPVSAPANAKKIATALKGCPRITIRAPSHLPSPYISASTRPTVSLRQHRPTSATAERGPITLPAPTMCRCRRLRRSATPKAMQPPSPTNWTKHDRCLARDFGRMRCGDQGYAREELVAELGSAFLCADLGITPDVRPYHADYIAS